MEDKPPGLIVIFSPLLKKLGHESLGQALVTQLGGENTQDVIYMVSSDRLCNNLESPAEMLTPHQKPGKDLTQSKGPHKALQLPSGDVEAETDAKDEEETEAVCEGLVRLCRHTGHLAPRATLVCLREQLQALLLCLARHNKEVSGDFSADASDLLAAWNIMKKEAFETPVAGKNRLSSEQVERAAPVSSGVRGLVESYASFVSSCRNVDVFVLHRALCDLVAERDLLGSKVVVVEGAVLGVEWQLLQPLLRAPSRVYVAVSSAAPLGNDSCGAAGFQSWQLEPVDTEGMSPEELFRACFCTYSTVTSTCSSVTTCNTVASCSTATTPAAKARPTGSPRGSPLTPALKKGAPCSTVSSVPSPYRTPRRRGRGLESLLYIRQVMICQLRLLLNTRDEMALAVSCSLPGTAMSPAAFAAIKVEARRINMPMFQTVMSVVQKRRLGGCGYQLSSSSAVLPHLGPLTEFVDHINELSGVVEDVACVGTAARKILAKIKRYVTKQCTGVHAQKCPVKMSSIEVVYKGLQDRLDQCLRRFEYRNKISSSKSSNHGSNSSAANRPKLPYPVLSLLQSMCDRCTSEFSFGDDSVASFVSLCEGQGCEIVMSQGGGSPIAFTPVRVPSVLTLFGTPPPVDNLDGEEVIAEPNLRMRVMKGTRATPVRGQRNVSCMAWAPDNLSPVQVLASPELTSSVPPLRPSSQDVLAAIAALPDRTEGASTNDSPKRPVNERRKATRKNRETLPGPKRSLLKDISNLEANVGCRKENEKFVSSQNGSDEGVEPSKRCSKRSLLSDISNLAANSDGCKKAKTVSRKPAGKKHAGKTLPAGQKSIASFFVVKPK